MGGFGAIIRDAEGIAIAAAAGSSSHSSINIIELQGVEVGLILAENNGVRDVIVGTDSTNCVQYIKHNTPPPWQAIPIVRRIKQMIQRLNHFDIVHIFRETNRAADHLASLFIDTQVFNLWSLRQAHLQRIFRKFCMKMPVGRSM